MEKLIKEYIAAVAIETAAKARLAAAGDAPNAPHFYQDLYDARENIIDWALAIAKAAAEQYTSDQAILNSELIRLGIRSAT